jgi:hypothetical protein
MSNIVLYSTGCTRCSVLKGKLDTKGIRYEENRSVNDLIALGFRQVPMLSVDGTIMDFSTAVKWVNEQPNQER